MKKSKADNNAVFDSHRQNFVGKVFRLSRYQVVVEDVIAEGLLLCYCCSQDTYIEVVTDNNINQNYVTLCYL